MSKAIIVELYDELNGGGNLLRYSRKVGNRYNEGTLQRLLHNHDMAAREAALIAMRTLGSMASNEAVARCLLSPSTPLRDLAEEALWAIWFRADRPETNKELERLLRLIHEEKHDKALLGLTELIRRSPKFAEAYNQRAIVHWQRHDYEEAIADCQRAVKLNRLHFGALSGMAQCFLQLNKPVEALRAFRQAQKIHPGLEGVRDNILSLEQMLREERRRNREDRREIG